VTFADVGTLAEVYRAADDMPAGGLITLANASGQLRQVIERAELHHPRVVVGP
jgi:hypothetical protein